jgi:hypothetical protein
MGKSERVNYYYLKLESNLLLFNIEKQKIKFSLVNLEEEKEVKKQGDDHI